MKMIKYKILTEIKLDTEESPVVEQVFNNVEICCTERNLASVEALARKEAYNGEYTVEDDGQPEPVAKPTQLDAIEAQVAYTAMMTDTLLEV